MRTCVFRRLCLALCPLLFVPLLSGFLSVPAVAADSDVTINVYNWGQDRKSVV